MTERYGPRAAYLGWKAIEEKLETGRNQTLVAYFEALVNATMNASSPLAGNSFDVRGFLEKCGAKIPEESDRPEHVFAMAAREASARATRGELQLSPDDSQTLSALQIYLTDKATTDFRAAKEAIETHHKGKERALGQILRSGGGEVASVPALPPARRFVPALLAPTGSN